MSRGGLYTLWSAILVFGVVMVFAMRQCSVDSEVDGETSTPSSQTIDVDSEQVMTSLQSGGVETVSQPVDESNSEESGVDMERVAQWVVLAPSKSKVDEAVVEDDIIDSDTTQIVTPFDAESLADTLVEVNQPMIPVDYKGGLKFSERPVLDRGINRNPFIYRGEFIGGVWATHMSASSDNSQFLLMLNNISAAGSYTSVKPYLGYAYRDNRVVGVRFGYTDFDANIESATLDFGDANDLSFEIPYVGYSQRKFYYGIFHRSYAGLDAKGRFAVFADLDLSYYRASSKFDLESGGEIGRVSSNSWGVDLDFNPGVAVYMFSNVSATISFGLGGINYSSSEQYDIDGEKVGEKSDSKLSFKFNILAINIGVNIHLWSPSTSYK